MMLDRISNNLRHFSGGWVTAGGLLVFLLFVVLVLPAQTVRAEAAGGGNGFTPDLSLFYTPGDLYAAAETYGQEGRSAYIHARWTFDLIWPLVYTFFLATSISWLTRVAFPAGSVWHYANLTPLLAALLDYLENASTSLVFARYPLVTPGVDGLAPVFTLIKWLLVGSSVLILLASLSAAVWQWMKRGT